MVQVVGGLPRSQRKLGTQNGLEVIVVSDAEKRGGIVCLFVRKLYNGYPFRRLKMSR